MSDPRWYDRAVEEIEQQHADGLLTNEQYHSEMRELNAELRQAADDEAERARDNYLGSW